MGGRAWQQLVTMALAWPLVACATLPKHIDRPVSTAITDTRGSALGRLIGPMAEQHPSESGFLLYNSGEPAIQARVALAAVAESTIDAQYYEWAGDALGRAILDQVIAAADRGVRVRLLIDDYAAKGHDLAFEVLDAHPKIEVRVFNPYVRGRFRLPQMFGRFAELNHRMHNKMFLVDGQAAIVGGRNLADEYFGMGKKLDFRDFDLLAIGAVVPQAEAAFDCYWNSQWAYPITALRKPSSLDALRRKRARFAAHVAADGATFPYPLPRDHEAALARIGQFRDQVIWAPAEVVYDDPSLMAKPLHGQPTQVGQKLIALTRKAQHEIVAENAYLVPHEHMPLLNALRERGVKVQLLTNSLATTDVVAVNAAYSKSRPKLAELGVALYEMKPYATSRELYVARATTSQAHLALHGKAAVFDRETVFLGSFNLDPRSMSLDTEAVFVVHSPTLAARLLDAFATDFEPANAWHIGHVVGKNDVAWISQRPGRTDVEPHDPARWWLRVRRTLSRLLPIRKYL
jgi:putative cardiolipin synthase